MTKSFSNLSKEEKVKFWREIEGQIRRILKEIELGNPTEISKLLDHNKLGLAYQYLIGELADRETPISKQVFKSLHAVGQQMGFDETQEQGAQATWATFQKLPVK